MSHAGAIAILALPVLGAVTAGLMQLRNAFRRPVLLPEDLALAFAWIYPVGAAFWLEAWLTGSRRLGFEAPWTWLTAAHFLVAGFGALTVSAWMTRTVSQAGARHVLYGVLIAHPIAFAAVAAGLAGVPLADEIGTLVYGSLFIVQGITFIVASRSEGSALARIGLGLAVWVPVFTLVPAVGWAWGRPAWSLDEMVVYHGLTNAIAHVGLGLAMLAWLRPPRRLPPLRAPLSALHGVGRVRASVLGRASRAVSGLTDDLSAYGREGFDVAALPSEIVAFYEKTDEFEFDLRGRWHFPFVVGGRIWSRRIAPALGQLGLPPPGHTLRDAALESRIVDAEDDLDGRSNVRGWLRRWRHDGSVLYVAAYSEHARGGTRYMNIAFPLPGGFNLTSILHLERGSDLALNLTSRHHRNFGGDQGVYLVRRGRPWRLPLDETISVYAAEDAPPDVPAAAGSTLVARHEMWLAGVPYLTMHYQIRRRGAP